MLSDYWKVGQAPPLVADLEIGGLGIDVINKQAYSKGQDGSIFSISQVPLEGIRRVEFVTTEPAGTNDEVIYATHRASTADEGGGHFVYDTSLAGVDDGGMVIHGWVRQNAASIDVRYFGAQPHTGNSNTELNTAAFRLASEYAISQGALAGGGYMPEVHVGPGSWHIATATIDPGSILDPSDPAYIPAGEEDVTQASFAETTWNLDRGAKMEHRSRVFGNLDNLLDLTGFIRFVNGRAGDDPSWHSNVVTQTTHQQLFSRTYRLPSTASLTVEDTCGKQAIQGFASTSANETIDTTFLPREAVGIFGAALADTQINTYPGAASDAAAGRYEVRGRTNAGAVAGLHTSVFKEFGSSHRENPYGAPVGYANNTPASYGMVLHTSSDGDYNEDGCILGGPITAHLKLEGEWSGLASEGAYTGILFTDESLAAGSYEAIAMPHDYKMVHYHDINSVVNGFRSGEHTQLVKQSDDLDFSAQLRFVKTKANEGQTVTGDELGTITFAGYYEDAIVDAMHIKCYQYTNFINGPVKSGLEFIFNKEPDGSGGTGMFMTNQRFAPNIDAVSNLGHTEYRWNHVYSMATFTEESYVRGEAVLINSSATIIALQEKLAELEARLLAAGL